MINILIRFNNMFNISIFLLRKKKFEIQKKIEKKQLVEQENRTDNAIKIDFSITQTDYNPFITNEELNKIE